MTVIAAPGLPRRISSIRRPQVRRGSLASPIVGKSAEHCPHDQLVFGQLAGRHLFFALDVCAVLADSWEDNPCCPLLAVFSFGFVAAHDEFVEVGFAD